MQLEEDLFNSRQQVAHLQLELELLKASSQEQGDMLGRFEAANKDMLNQLNGKYSKDTRDGGNSPMIEDYQPW